MYVDHGRPVNFGALYVIRFFLGGDNDDVSTLTIDTVVIVVDDKTIEYRRFFYARRYSNGKRIIIYVSVRPTRGVFPPPRLVPFPTST